MKKGLTIILCLVMILSLFAGCKKSGGTETQNNGTQNGNVDGTGSTGGGNVENPGEQITLTIGLQPSSVYVEDYNTNAFTLWLEEQTGYNLEFEYFSNTASEMRTQIAGRIAIGEKLPDILWGCDLGAVAMNDYGSQGYFLDLTPYFEDKEGASKVFWERLSELTEDEQLDTQRRMLKDPYILPSMEQSLVDPMNFQPWINREWMDELNLKDPTDPESLYQVLKAFKARDPNCIPLIGQTKQPIGGDVVNWLVNMFVYVNTDRYFSIDDDGKLFFPQTTDAYREAMIYIHKLAAEGLLYPGSFTMGGPDLKNTITPANGNALVGIWVGHTSLHINDDSPVFYEYEPLDCFGYAFKRANLHNERTCITIDCEHPDAAFNLLMTMYTKDAATRMRYGEYGVDWVEADEGAKSAMGLDAEIKLLNDAWVAPHNTLWRFIDGTLLVNAEGEVVQVSENESEWNLHKAQMNAKQYENFMRAYESNDIKNYCPALTYTAEETKEYQQIISDCSNIINNTRAKFCTAELDPSDDAAWNTYLQQLEDQGAQEWLALAQRTYDSYQ